ncbi:MAG TPA: PEP-CTERM sorting domain-containing protein [Bryobacteraceae bacterium]|jgi:hypothetical protein
MRLLMLLTLSSCVCSLFAQPSDTAAVTPAPSSIVLLAVGMAGVGLATWRRNRKR